MSGLVRIVSVMGLVGFAGALSAEDLKTSPQEKAVQTPPLVIRTPPRAPVEPPLTLKKAAAGVEQILPTLGEALDLCDTPSVMSGEAVSVELRVKTLIERMRTYPELRPLAEATIAKWQSRARMGMGHCRRSGKGGNRTHYDTGSRAIRMRDMQIDRVSLAFTKFRIAAGR